MYWGQRRRHEMGLSATARKSEEAAYDCNNIYLANEILVSDEFSILIGLMETRRVTLVT